MSEIKYGDEGRQTVSVLSPRAIFGLVQNPEAEQLATEVEQKLVRVLAAIE
ncbi:MAG TPA: hypothetical protein VM425_14980 [Myxococcota bacterium]|nr:hypothetical protein [Myxococcota bacterium]